MDSSSIEPFTYTGNDPSAGEIATTGSADPSYSALTGNNTPPFSLSARIEQFILSQSPAASRSYVCEVDQTEQADYEEFICGSLLARFYFPRYRGGFYRLKVTLVPDSRSYQNRLPSAAEIADKGNRLDPLFQVESQSFGKKLHPRDVGENGEQKIIEKGLHLKSTDAWDQVCDYWVQSRSRPWELPEGSRKVLREAVGRAALAASVALVAIHNVPVRASSPVQEGILQSLRQRFGGTRQSSVTQGKFARYTC